MERFRQISFFLNAEFDLWFLFTYKPRVMSPSLTFSTVSSLMYSISTFTVFTVCDENLASTFVQQSMCTFQHIHTCQQQQNTCLQYYFEKCIQNANIFCTLAYRTIGSDSESGTSTYGDV
ncbi:hypothetical protein Mapa_003641 [Marchantia paleacea]|nr:hypothetical protein Mapa_003641 [Marchantia paleacea]